MPKELYEFLKNEKKYSENDLLITEISLHSGMGLPESVRNDLSEYYRKELYKNVK